MYDAQYYDRGRRDENVPFWVEEAVRMGGLGTSSAVLDLGCGTGIYTLGLRTRLAGWVCGLDPSVEMLRVGRSKDQGGLVDWVRGVAESLPFRDASFNAVFSSQAWHHIRDRRRAANECHRVLKPGSPLIIRTISLDQWREKPVCNFFPEVLPSQLRVYPSTADFKEFLGSAGFESPGFHPYRLERYTEPEEFIEAAEKKLWSMFQYVSEEGLKAGIERLRGLSGQPIRNDELITLVVAWKRKRVQPEASGIG